MISFWNDKTVNELKSFWFIVDRSQVLNLRANEKDRSGVALVAALTKTAKSPNVLNVFLIFCPRSLLCSYIVCFYKNTCMWSPVDENN